MNRGQLIELIIICSIIITILSLSGCIEDSNDNDNNDQNLEEDWRYWPIIKSSVNQTIGEVLAENSITTITIYNINESYLTQVFFELHWNDEDNLKDNGTYKVQNQPDYFNFTVNSPWGERYYSETLGNSHNGSGIIFLNISVPSTYEGDGSFLVNIYCGDCGDQVAVGPGVSEGPVVEEDAGNGWELLYYYKYHSKN